VTRAVVIFSLVAVAAVVAVYSASRAADAAALPNDEADGADGTTVLDVINPWQVIGGYVEQRSNESAMNTPNLAAFLSMIAFSEGTDGAADPYRVCYAYKHTIDSLAQHPAEVVDGVREWAGEKLPDAMCRSAGLSPGCVSTAAGRYQLIRPTWIEAKRALGLTDFSPASQDAAAVYLIRKRGALSAVERGQVANAIALCRKEWASLPGADYGQPERRLSALLDVYERSGGAFA
jgi:muramidase (phage lysozyme)